MGTEYGRVAMPGWADSITRSPHPIDGSTVYSSVASPPANPEPIVLLHGIGNSGAVFSPLLPSLAQYGPVAAPTMSVELLQPTSGDPDDRVVVRGLIDWLTAIAAPPWKLIGHSMGGLLAGLIARTEPELVSQLLLVNSPLPSVVDRLHGGVALDRTGRALLMMKSLARLTAIGRPRVPSWLGGAELAVVRTGLRGFVNDPGALDAEVIRRALVWSRTSDGIDFLRLADELPEWDLEPFADRPVEIVLGGKDPLVPASDHPAIGEAYPRATTVIADDCAHFVHLERPEVVLGVVDRYL